MVKPCHYVYRGSTIVRSSYRSMPGASIPLRVGHGSNFMDPTRPADATTRPNPTRVLFENWGPDPTHRTANTNFAIDADKTEALS